MDPNEDPDYADIEDLLASSEEEAERGAPQIQAELDRTRAHANWCRVRLARLRSQRCRMSLGLKKEVARLVCSHILEYPAGYSALLSQICLLKLGRLEGILNEIEEAEGWLREAVAKERALAMELAQLSNNI